MMEDFSNSYLELLNGEFRGINLTRIGTKEEFYNKQILDSVLPLKMSKLFATELAAKGIMVDIGFGGGFPILPLAKTLPNIKFVGFDARSKKVEVVTLIAEKLGIQNVKLMHMRFEEVVFDRPVVITFKAVGKISEILPLIKSTEKLLVCFYKGPNFYELEEIGSIEKDWEVKEEITYDVAGTEGRTLICFKNKNVLRGTINSKFIKFSELL
jgi:16S rRNA (guanine527-N7)-methyltransferase